MFKNAVSHDDFSCSNYLYDYDFFKTIILGLK